MAYPDVLRIDIRDSAGELWRLATQDAALVNSEFSEIDCAGQLPSRWAE